MKKVQEYLEIIVRNDTKQQFITTFTTDDPVKLSYSLREAKKYLGEKINHAYYNNVYLHLKCIPNYAFRIEGNKVIARLSVPKATEENAPEYIAVSKHIARSISDPLAAIGYLIEHRNIECVEFPDLPLDASIIAIEKWAKKNNYLVERIGESRCVQVKKCPEGGNVTFSGRT